MNKFLGALKQIHHPNEFISGDFMLLVRNQIPLENQPFYKAPLSIIFWLCNNSEISLYVDGKPALSATIDSPISISAFTDWKHSIARVL